MTGVIVRHWKARVIRSDIDEWIATFRTRALPGMQAVEGWLGVAIDCERDGDPCNVTVTTRWRDEAALRLYAGENVIRAVVPEFMQRFLVAYDPEATFRDELVMEYAK